MGGDEFYVLLPRTAVPEAIICMERIRNRFQTVAFGGSSGSVFGVTASFGIAGLTVQKTSAELIEAADRALYEAKARGRNMVHVASQSDEMNLDFSRLALASGEAPANLPIS